MHDKCKHLQEQPRSPQTSPAITTKVATVTPTTPPADSADGLRLSAVAEPPTTNAVGDGEKEGDADGKNGTIDAGTTKAASSPQSRIGLANPKKLLNKLLADVRASLKMIVLTLTELTATSAEASVRKTRATIVRCGAVEGDAAVDAPAARRRRRRPSTTLPIRWTFPAASMISMTAMRDAGSPRPTATEARNEAVKFAVHAAAA
jgi:hypothetical protein